jgi:hypothetical protein
MSLCIFGLIARQIAIEQHVIFLLSEPANIQVNLFAGLRTNMFAGLPFCGLTGLQVGGFAG